MCIDGQFYFHTVMPFGLRSATLAVSYILNKEGILVDVYLLYLVFFVALIIFVSFSSQLFRHNHAY